MVCTEEAGECAHVFPLSHAQLNLDSIANITISMNSA